METNRINAVEIFNDFVELPDSQRLFEHRLLIEQASKRLKEIKEALDLELIRRMKADKIQSFEVALANGINKITFGQKKKETITDLPRLKKMLSSEDVTERELANLALSASQSAWKIAQVKVLADTLGIDGMVQTEYEDKIEVKVIPIEMLEKKQEVKNG